MSTVSAIMPVYNGERFLKEAIESVLCQTYEDVELIVIDDASGDQSGWIAKGFSPRLQYIRHTKNMGLSVARNTGVEAARGKYVAFIDQDDVWLPEKIKEQIISLETNKEIPLCFSDVDIIDAEGKRHGSLFKLCPPHKGMVFEQLLKENFIPIITAVVKKDIFKEIGFFDPKFSITEDWDLFLRISRLYPITFINRPLAQYRVHSGSFSRHRDIIFIESIKIINKYENLADKITLDLLKIKKRKLQFMLGMTYLREGAIDRARGYFLGKIKRDFFYLNFWLGLLAAYLPDRYARYIGCVASLRRLHDFI